MILYNQILKAYYSTLVNSDKFFFGFSTREIGDGRRIETIFNFLNQHKISFEKVIIPEQIHSANVELVEKKNNPEIILRANDTDAVITKKINYLLTVVTADCLPIIFIEEKTGIIAISHQGWRGTIKKIGLKIIDQIISLGGNINKIKIIIGPGIGQCCYSINEERYYQFLEEFDGYSKKIFFWRKNQIFFNLLKLNYLLFINKEIKKENIDFFPFCTFCQKDKFFSYRRYKQKNDHYGEMLSFVMKT